MTLLVLILRIVFGLFLIYAGVMHFVKPKFFNGFIPKPLPKLTINYVIGSVEILIGVGLLISSTAKNSGKAFFILMLAFLPIHIWDLSKNKPTIGSKKIAIIRVLLQLVLLYAAYLIFKVA